MIARQALLAASLLLAASAAPCQSVASDKSFAAMTTQGDTYGSACSPAEWSELRASLLHAAGQDNPQGLLVLARTYLCRSGAAADASLHQNMPQKIAVAYEETGTEGQTRSYESRDGVSALGGAAWDGRAENTGAGIRLSYRSNEACVASVTFAYKANAWLLVGHSEACD